MPVNDATHSIRIAVAAITLPVLSACALSGAPHDNGNRQASVPAASTACRSALVAAKPRAQPALDPASIRLVNWNVRKAGDKRMPGDLARLAGGSELVLVQEALRGATGASGLPPHAAFAPGYRRGTATTGVLTLSSVAPLTECRLSAIEPLLRTPKATSVTLFPLRDTALTLAVVNVHAVNFSWGLRAYRRQLTQIAETLAAHRGPIILSGDFNTWRAARQRLLNDLARELGLAPVAFVEDRRTRVFGRALDHLYVRDLYAVSANVPTVDSSDHNPLVATLGMATSRP